MSSTAIGSRTIRAGAAAVQPSRPWYRQMWPWLLMLPPLASVLAGSTILYLAVSSPADLAVSDYARIEELTDERFARDARAAALGVAATIEIGPRTDGAATVAITLSGKPAPPWLRVALQHVARSGADVELRLPAATRDPHRYEGEAGLAAGEYEIEIAPPDDSWRLAGTLPRGATVLELQPQRAAQGE